jgi:hypothetical protein
MIHQPLENEWRAFAYLDGLAVDVDIKLIARAHAYQSSEQPIAYV